MRAGVLFGGRGGALAGAARDASDETSEARAARSREAASTAYASVPQKRIPCARPRSSRTQNDRYRWLRLADCGLGIFDDVLGDAQRRGAIEAVVDPLVEGPADLDALAH